MTFRSEEVRETEIGDRVSFIPECMVAEPGGNLMKSQPSDRRETVTGEVVYSNRLNHWSRVQYRLPGTGGVQYQCFPLPAEASEKVGQGQRGPDRQPGVRKTGCNA